MHFTNKKSTAIIYKAITDDYILGYYNMKIEKESQ